MRRRVLLASTAAAALSSGVARAQQKPMPVIGILATLAREPADEPFETAFAQGLSESGYVYGQTVAREYRSAEGHYDRLESLAADLISREVDVIVATGVPAAHAAKKSTSTIPIVFMGGGDAVASGLVASLAKPGGNVTGTVDLVVELFPKRLEILRELVPHAGVIGLLVNPSNPNTERVIRDMQKVAQLNGVQLHTMKAGAVSEIDAAFDSLDQRQVGALVIAGDLVFISRRPQIVALVARHAVPAIYAQRSFAAAGGLISYSSNITALVHQAGVYTGRILKGAKPADLPVQQPTKYELFINMKTAKALGLTIPPSILARADEVIE